MYSLAAYFRLYGQEYSYKHFIFYGIMFILVNFSSVIAFDLISLKWAFLGKYALYFCAEMMRPFVILGSTCLMLGFSRLEIPHNRFINLLASETFGVYMLHDD